MNAPPPPADKLAADNRFASLDILRALASFVVVIYHWGHFTGKFIPANAGVPPPFAGPLSFAYARGHEAVDLFFCLSGFIFYWLYAAKISARAVPLKKFAVLRISRLYPLHLATLLAAAALQFLFKEPFVYDVGAKRFLLHLFMASEWFGAQGFSFNGPAWSISIEVLLYAVFFATCWFIKPRPIVALGFVALGLALVDGNWNLISRGLISFHMGAISFFALRALETRLANRGRLAVLAACVAAWCVIPLLTDGRHTLELVRGLIGADFKIHGKDVAAALVLPLAPQLTALILFPLTVLALTLNDSRWGTLAHRFGFIGNASYSSYLLHFPLQLVFLVTFLKLGLDTRLLLSPWTMALFFAILIPLSLLSFTKFERPAQDWIRARFIPRGAGAAAKPNGKQPQSPDIPPLSP